MKKSVPGMVLFAAVTLVSSACLENGETPVIRAGLDSEGPLTPSPLGPDTDPTPTPTTIDKTKLVCDGFGNRAGTGLKNGLRARIKAADRTQAPGYRSVWEYQLNATPVDVDAYFSKLDTDPQPFPGFVNEAGSTVLDADGQVIDQYFTVHMDAEIRLSSTDRPGKYQLAIISDDGAVLQARTNGTFRALLDNDLTDKPRVECASQSIIMDAASRLPIQIDYFQSRGDVAFLVLWREIPADRDEVRDPSVLSDPSCGFKAMEEVEPTPSPSPTASPLPTPTPTLEPPGQPAWQSMLERGWKILQPENYYLQGSGATNPCASSQGPGLGT